jgi:predicted dehydrogenase
MDNNKLGIALVGLGMYSTEQLGPALKQTKHCYLAGIVSGDTDKSRKWSKEYSIKEENIYNYENFDEIKSNDDIDIVYVVLPNTMHADFVVRAARAGKHIICEKPLATTVEDCHRMIESCRDAGVKLSVGYRLHFEPFNKEIMRLGQNEIFGPVRSVIARDSMDIGDPRQWRLKKELAGGGPLLNNGVYCVQGALFITGELPVSVAARFSPITNPQKFNEVEEGITWEMDFESGKKVVCETSYSKDQNLLRAEAERGWFELEPAYEYKGLKGRTSEGQMNFPAINQQAAQMDDFALCLKNNIESRVPGEMGLRDVQIMLAIYESARTGRKIELHLEAFQKLVEM